MSMSSFNSRLREEATAEKERKAYEEGFQLTPP